MEDKSNIGVALLSVISAFRRYMDAQEDINLIASVPSRKKIEETLAEYETLAREFIEEKTE